METDYKEEKMEGKFDKILIFVVPIWYTLKTRFIKRSSKGFLFWASEYLFPVVLTMLCMDLREINALYAFLAVLSVYCFYELGYIQNDCETIKKESNPTLRLEKDELAVYEKFKPLIYILRFLYVLAFIIYYYTQGLSFGCLAVLILILPLYLVYNTVRGKICDYLISFLTAYRYCMPLVLYKNGLIDSVAIAYIVMAYIFPTFLQYCVREKNGPPSMIALKIVGPYKYRDVFRIKYYSFFFVLSLIAVFAGWLPVQYLSVALYFLVFRIATYKYRMKLN